MIEYCLAIYLKCVDVGCVSAPSRQEVLAAVQLTRYPYRSKGSCEYAFRKYRHNPHYGHTCWKATQPLCNVH